jgi:hypothetical protein
MKIRGRRTACFALIGCIALAVTATPALAKKKKRKPVKLGPVVTVTATGNPVATGGQDSTAVATCPTGKQVVGGGFSAPLSTSTAMYVHDSYRSSSQSWTVVGMELGGTPNAATAIAYCRNTTKSPISDVAQAQSISGTFQTATLTPSCPAGTQLVSGGFQATHNSSDIFLVEQSAPGPGRAWSVTGEGVNPLSQSLIAHAYCLAGISAPKVLSQSNTLNLASGTPFSVTTGACPKPPKPKKGKKKKPAQLLSAGGFNGPTYTGSGPLLLWSESSVVAPGWRSTAFDAGGPGAATLTSYGVCV